MKQSTVPKGKHRNKYSPKRVDTKLRQFKALEMRAARADFQTIADKLGYADKSGAYRAVVAAITELPKADADLLRSELGVTLDALIQKLWPRLDTAEFGEAGRTILRAVERYASMMGLDLDPKAAEMLQAALAAAHASATANVFVIGGEKKRPEDLTFEELDIVEAHLAENGE